MNVDEILSELKKKGTDQTKKTFLRHGAKEPLYGVKVADLKVLQKKIKVNHELSLELYDTGNSDAMYLAMLIADPKKMNSKILDHWVKKATWSMISEYAVAWTAAESEIGWEQGLKWLKDKKESIACAGWATLCSWVAIQPDDKLDLKKIESLLGFIEKNIHQSPNRVKYVMNLFVISVGGYVKPLHKLALETAKKIGKVKVDMGDTSCSIPDAIPYIKKMVERVKFKKKKMARC